MNVRSLKRKNAVMSPTSETIDDDYSSDYDENIDSDDDYEEESQAMNPRAKRFQTSYRDADVFRNVSSSISSLDGKNKKSIERMPTRRPNPKISNRNAVMARENRKKKKEYLESLQKNMDQFQSENKKLRKLLNSRNSMISKLTHESMYLKSVLANKTEIMSLLKTIQGNRVPITSSALSFVTEGQQYNDTKSENRADSYGGSSGCSPASSLSPSPYTEDEKENDLDSHFDFPQSIGSELQWESLLNNNSMFKQTGQFAIPDIRDIDDSEILSTNGSHNVNHEHNYFNNPVKPNKVADESTPGVCLHVSCGRVSLEFCSTCHLNSQNAWIEEM